MKIKLCKNLTQPIKSREYLDFSKEWDRKEETRTDRP